MRESPVLMSCMSMLQSIRMNVEESERWYGELEAYAANHTGSARKAGFCIWTSACPTGGPYRWWTSSSMPIP